MIPNLSYILNLYKNPVDTKSTLISTAVAYFETFFPLRLNVLKPLRVYAPPFIILYYFP